MPIRISALAARRFLLQAQGLATPFPGIGAALDHLGYVQIDPINVCGRMHDLVLRNRVAGYREGDLMRHLHGTGSEGRKAESRTAFEHHLPHTHVLVAFPNAVWPHLLAAMQARTRTASAWSGRLTPREKALAPSLLEEIARRGPMGSADFDDPGRSRKIWGAATLAKATLQKLFFHGRLMIAARANNHRRYDLPERVLPSAIRALPPPSAAETARWIALLKMKQFRLALLKRAEALSAADALQVVQVDGCPPLHCLREDMGALEQAVAESEGLRAESRRNPAFPTLIHQPASPGSPALRLLAPLDPLIYQRRVTRVLWDFNYTWEVYTPPAKRVRGYYALPVLAGTELVGHVDPKADRAAGRLQVIGKKVRRGHVVVPAVRELAGFLGLAGQGGPAAPLRSPCRKAARRPPS